MHIRALNQEDYRFKTKNKRQGPSQQIASFYRSLLRERKFHEKNNSLSSLYPRGKSNKEEDVKQNGRIMQNQEQVPIKIDLHEKMKMNRMRQIKNRNRMKQKVKEKVQQQFLSAIQQAEKEKKDQHKNLLPNFQLKSDQPKSKADLEIFYRIKAKRKQSNKVRSAQSFTKKISQKGTILDLSGINIKNTQIILTRNKQISHLLSFRLNQNIKKQLDSLPKKEIILKTKEIFVEKERKRRKTLLSGNQKMIEIRKVENIQPWIVKTDQQDQQQEDLIF